MGVVRATVDALPAYVPGRGAGTEVLTQLASNESPFPPLPSVVAAIQDEATRVHRYPISGSPAVREAIAEKYSLGADQVAVGAGSVAVLAQLCSVVLEPGLAAVYPWRSFEAYPLVVTVTGAQAVGVPLVDDALDLPALAAAVTPATRLLMVCSPNNPTGTLTPAADIEHLLDTVPESCLVVLDEAYLDYVDQAEKPPAVEWLDEHPNLVLLRTFSKAHGLAGLRVGYSLSSPELATALNKVTVPFTVTALAQRAAIASLAADAELAERVDLVRSERDRVLAALHGHGLPVPASQANFVWVPDAVRPPGLARVLAGTGVLVRDFPEGTRITIGTPAENDLLLEALTATLART